MSDHDPAIWAITLGEIRTKRSRVLPVVLRRDEVQALLDGLEDGYKAVALVLYGGGVRLVEALAFRIEDLDLNQGVVHVRRGKGGATGRAFWRGVRLCGWRLS